MHLEEKTLQVEEIYNGKIFRVTRETAQVENGDQVFREVVHHSGGVCVVALTDNEEIIFVRQFRYPFQKVLLEVPAGKREEGEDPKACGIRELREEAGATAGSVVDLGVLYPTVAYDTEVIHMYLATELSFGEQMLDDDEFLDVVRIPLDQAYEMVMRGEIPDAKTQIAVLKTYLRMRTHAD